MDTLNRAISKYQDMIGMYDKQPWERSIERAVSQSLNKLTRKRGKVNNDLIDLDLVRGSSLSKIKPRHSWISISRKALYRVLFLPLCFKWWRKCTGVPTSTLLLILYLLQIFSFYLYSTDNITPHDEALTLSHLLTPCIIYLILAILNTQITSTGSLSSTSSSSPLPPSNSNTSSTDRAPNNKISNVYFPQNKNPSCYLDGGKKFVFPGDDDEEEDDEDTKVLYTTTNQKQWIERTNKKETKYQLNKHGKKHCGSDNDVKEFSEKYEVFKRYNFREVTSGAVEGDQANMNNSNNKCNPENKENIDEVENVRSLSANQRCINYWNKSNLYNKYKNLSTNNIYQNSSTALRRQPLEFSQQLNNNQQQHNNYPNSKQQHNNYGQIPKIHFQFENFENDFEQDDEEEEDDDSYSVISLWPSARNRLSLKMGGMLGVGGIKGADTNSTTSSIHSDDDDDDDDEVEEDVMMMRESSSSSIKNNSKKSWNRLGKSTLNKIGKSFSSMNANTLNINQTNNYDKHNHEDDDVKMNGDDGSLSWKSVLGLDGGRHLNFNNGRLFERFGLRKRKSTKMNFLSGNGGEYLNAGYSPGNEDHFDDGGNNENCHDNRDKADGGNENGEDNGEGVKDGNSVVKIVETIQGIVYKEDGDIKDRIDEKVDAIISGGCIKTEGRAGGEIDGGQITDKVIDTNNGGVQAEVKAENKVIFEGEKMGKGVGRCMVKSSSLPTFKTPKDTNIGLNSLPFDEADNEVFLCTQGNIEQQQLDNSYSERSVPASVNKLYSAIENKVSCIIWENNEIQKVNLSVLDIGWNIIKKVDKSCLSYDYFILGLFSSILLSIIPIIFRTYHSWNQIEALHLTTNTTDLSLGLQIALGRNWRQVLIILNGVTQRFWLSLMLFFMLAVSERTFYQRLLYAKNFCYLTSLRRARKYRLPHFRLNKVRNIKMWLSVRSFLKRRGPQRSVEVIVSMAFLASVIIISTICIEILQDYGCFLDELSNWEMAVWGLSIGVFLLRFITLGTSINKKYRNFSVLITEQINLYLHMEQKPHKKNELMMANSVLKLAEDLLKEVESPFKVSGFSANPLLYNITKVVVLSAFSAVISELLGFKLKLYKIKIRA